MRCPAFGHLRQIAAPMVLKSGADHFQHFKTRLGPADEGQETFAVVNGPKAYGRAISLDRYPIGNQIIGFIRPLKALR